MKTKILYSAVFAFILSSLLTSCSFLQKGEFAQRKYYNFPRPKNNVEGVQTAIKTEQMPAVVQQTVTEKIAEVKKETLPSGENAMASADKKPLSAAFKESRFSYSEKRNSTSSIADDIKIKDEVSDVSLKAKDLFKIVRKKTTPSSSSDGMLIIELILAIILPPLAVLIHKGDVSKWFWIDLLLWIFSGVIWLGVRYPGPGGLLWLAAVIIAICYVLGVIRS